MTATAPAPRHLLAGAPAVPPAAAALSRLLGRGLRLALPTASMQWLVLPAAPGGDAGDWLVLDTGAGPLYLCDGARFIAGLTGIDGGACVDAWPAWMVGAVAGRLAGTALAGLRAIAPGGPPDGACLPLPWRLVDAGHAISGVAAATPQYWQALLAGAAPIRMPWPAWLALARNWPLVLATHRLPLALYDRLRSGAVILPADARFDVAGHGTVTLGPRRWQAVFAAPCRLQLLNEENPLDLDLTDTAIDSNMDLDDSAEDTAPLGAVSVTLRFELGRTRLTLDQLRTLGPQAVLDVQGGAPHAIAITCGGTEVGRGEVVDVDGRLGVRITDWSGAC